MSMERLINWLIPAIIIIIILALQYFIAYYKGGAWKYFIPIIFIIVLLILLFSKIITIGSFILYLIIGSLLLIEQSVRGQKNHNKEKQ